MESMMDSIAVCGGILFILSIVFFIWVMQDLKEFKKKEDAYNKWYASLPPEQQYMIDRDQMQRAALAWFLSHRD